MAEYSAISWTDATFNPHIGCTKVSPACAHCYAERDFDRRKHIAKWGTNGTRVMTGPENWKKPRKWNELAGMGVCLACHPTIKMDGTRRPCAVCNSTGKLERRPRIFCASLADVFEDWKGEILASTGHPIMQESRLVGPEGKTEWQPRPLTMDDVRNDLFKLIDATPNLDWLLLTKRPENIKSMWPEPSGLTGMWVGERDQFVDGRALRYRNNVWLGTSVENQEYADKRIPELLECRDLAPVLFLSCEPLLGPVEFSDVTARADAVSQLGKKSLHGIDWVIAGGESGPNARPSHPNWFRGLRDQCEAAGVPFHFKQWGEWLPHSQSQYEGAHFSVPGHKFDDENLAARVGVKQAGRLLDGVLHDAFPEVKAIAQ